jgi:hypothetical protein
VSFPFGAPGHIPGIHATGGTPIAAIYAAQAGQQLYIPALGPVDPDAQARIEREKARLMAAEREHARAVAAHENVSGWDARRAAELDHLIASSRPYDEPEWRGLAVGLGTVALTGLAFCVYAGMVAYAKHDAGNLIRVVLFSAPLLAMLVWSISHFAAWASWQRGQRWTLERRRLSQLRGCGVAGCPHCAAKRARSTSATAASLPACHATNPRH